MRGVNDEGLARLTIQSSRNQELRDLLIVSDDRPQMLEIQTAPPECVTGDLSALFNDPGVFRRAFEHPSQRHAAVGAEDLAIKNRDGRQIIFRHRARGIAPW